MISVALIEDTPEHAELFALHLEQIEGLKVDLSCFTSCNEALKALDGSPPDLLFVDYLLQEETGVDVIQALRNRGLNMPIIAITSLKDTYVAAKVSRAGADEYLDKSDLSADRLVELMDSMLAVGREREITEDERQKHAQNLSTLTNREQDVLDEIMSGKTNKEIAADLSRSIKTIKVHRGRIMTKMQASTPAELAKFVLMAREWRAA